MSQTGERSLSPAQRQMLAENGYVIVRGHLDADGLERLQRHLEALWTAEGDRQGVENYIEPATRRLANLADKGEIFTEFYADPFVLDGCQSVIGDDIRLSMLNARDALPNSGRRQPWHCDTDSSGTPDDGYYACTAIWMLDPFTTESGATFLLPGSHKSGKVPKQQIDDLTQTLDGEVRAVGEPGDLLIFNGHMWHAGGPNMSSGKRRALLAHYLKASHLPERADRRQQLSSATVQQLDMQQLRLLGYGN